MDYLKRLSREVQVVLGAGVLYLIFSFFDWQQVSGFGITVGRTEWSGIGIVAGLVAIALLAWEAGRLLGIKVPLGELSEGIVSLGIALLLALFTVITFATHGTARHWPAWIGLILSLVIAAAAVVRARGEGVQLPEARPASAAGAASAASVPTEPEPAPPAEPEAGPEAPALPEE
jgi:hypothetical protein